MCIIEKKKMEGFYYNGFPVFVVTEFDGCSEVDYFATVNGDVVPECWAGAPNLRKSKYASWLVATGYYD